MYLQLTTRCNMTCPHCCFACTSKGEDMSWETFLKAFYLDDMITFGGGEPTLWEYFPQMISWLKDSIFNLEHKSIFMVTNGTRYRNTRGLIKIKEMCDDFGLADIDIVMSYGDGFHDEKAINWRLWNYFLREDKFRDVRKIFKAGRGKEIGELEGCGCPDFIVKPNGDVYQCACEGAPLIGNVHDPYLCLGNMHCIKEESEVL